MGPICPLVRSRTTKVLPQWLVTGSVGWMAGLGQAGSAVFLCHDMESVHFNSCMSLMNDLSHHLILIRLIIIVSELFVL